jgi:hypothetical protein
MTTPDQTCPACLHVTVCCMRACRHKSLPIGDRTPMGCGTCETKHPAIDQPTQQQMSQPHSRVIVTPMPASVPCKEDLCTLSLAQALCRKRATKDNRRRATTCSTFDQLSLQVARSAGSTILWMAAAYCGEQTCNTKPSALQWL